LLEAKNASRSWKAKSKPPASRSRSTDQQLQIKSNDEYKAWKRKSPAPAGIRGLEDQELAAMERSRKTRPPSRCGTRRWPRNRRGVDEEVQAFLGRSAGLADELKRKEEERKAQAAGIDPTWLARYERIFAKQRDAAIALVEHGTCGSRHMKLSPSQVVEARKPDTITLCDFCGRMLYLA
jgi:predicted  nucleic acid-binding Zn-ribbon protein